MKFTAYKKMTALLSNGILEDVTHTAEGQRHLDTSNLQHLVTEDRRVYKFTASNDAQDKHDFEYEILQLNTLQGFVTLLFDAFLKVDLIKEHEQKTS